MKQIICVFLIVLILVNFSNSFCNIITVSNDINTPAQYIKIQDAHDAALENDTIYVSGTATYYSGVTITKPITLIGAGFNPNIQMTFPSKIQSIIFSSSSNLSASNSRISGFIINDVNINGSLTSPIINVILERNHITGGIGTNNTNGWIIKNNIIDGSIICNDNILLDLHISNNILTGPSPINSYNNTGNLIVGNNLFLNYNSRFTNGIKKTLFENNIFYGFSPYSDLTESCTFKNNIVFSSVNNNVNIIGTNSGSENLIGINPDFVNAPLSNAPSYNLLTYDFHLKSTSQGHNKGADGNDIGIYGGAYPFPSGGPSPFMTSPLPSIPQIIQMNIINSTIPLNGTLKVNVIGKKQD